MINNDKCPNCKVHIPDVRYINKNVVKVIFQNQPVIVDELIEGNIKKYTILRYCEKEKLVFAQRLKVKFPN